MRTKRYIKTKWTVQYISLYLLMLFSSGYYFRDHKGTRALLIIIVSVVVISMCNYKKRNLNRNKTILLTFIIILLCVISSIFNGDDIKGFFIYIIGFTGAVLLCTYVHFNNYVHIYVMLMRILVVCSIVFVVLQILFPYFYTMFSFANIYESGYFFILYMTHDYGSQVRNASIFWEPGAYQTFLVIAFFFEEYLKRFKYKKYQLLILVALLTTLSTTGIFCSLGLLVYYFIKPDRKRYKGLRNVLLILGILGFLVLAILMWEDRLSYLVQRNIIGKFAGLSNRNALNETTYVRIDSIVYPLKLFLSNPILGTGGSGMNSIGSITGHNMVTCTPINWFAKYGMIYGGFMCFGLYQTMKIMNPKRILRVLALLVMLTSISTENYIDNPMVIVMCIYGYHIRHKEPYTTDLLSKARLTVSKRSDKIII